MTDEQIIKAADICRTGECSGCPYHELYTASCLNKLTKDVYHLLNRQKAEIERLKKNIDGLNIFTTNHAEMQKNQCIEECAELIQAINKKHRGREHNIPEEIADVEICLEQLKMINNCADKVERYKTAKTERLKARITK